MEAESEQPKFVQILSDPSTPLYALDEAGVVWKWEMQWDDRNHDGLPVNKRMTWVALPGRGQDLPVRRAAD